MWIYLYTYLFKLLSNNDSKLRFKVNHVHDLLRYTKYVMYIHTLHYILLWYAYMYRFLSQQSTSFFYFFCVFSSSPCLKQQAVHLVVCFIQGMIQSPRTTPRMKMEVRFFWSDISHSESGEKLGVPSSSRDFWPNGQMSHCFVFFDHSTSF